MRPEYVYVASSWRNPLHIAVVAGLRAAGLACYDYRTDEGAGFHWSEVAPGWPVDAGGSALEVPFWEYRLALDFPRARRALEADTAAMRRADAFVLVLPGGRSAHLELGWAIGAGKRSAILFEGPDELVMPELMYGMVDFLAPGLFDLLGWLGVED